MKNEDGAVRTQYIVRLTNGLAVKFHAPGRRNIFETAMDAEATPFDLAAEADETARQYGMRAGTFEVGVLRR